MQQRRKLQTENININNNNNNNNSNNDDYNIKFEDIITGYVRNLKTGRRDELRKQTSGWEKLEDFHAVILAIYIGFLGLFIYLLNRFSFKVSPTPYMDEIFHFSQSNHYCLENWHIWDMKISTPPGLYYFTYIFNIVFKYCLQLFVYYERVIVGNTNFEFHDFEGKCLGGLFLMRTSQIIFIPFLLYAYYFVILKMIQKNRKEEEGEGGMIAVMISIQQSAFPLLMFYHFLYYTEIFSTTCVMMMYIFILSNHYFVASIIGGISIIVRQTNAVWVIFSVCTAILEQHEVIKYINMKNYHFSIYLQKVMMEKNTSHSNNNDNDANDDDDNTHRSGGGGDGLDVITYMEYKVFFIVYQLYHYIRSCFKYMLMIIRQFTGFILMFMLFLSIVIENEGLAMGDKSAHTLTLHLPQLFYFVVVYCLFYPFQSLKAIIDWFSSSSLSPSSKRSYLDIDPSLHSNDDNDHHHPLHHHHHHNSSSSSNLNEINNTEHSGDNDDDDSNNGGDSQQTSSPSSSSSSSKFVPRHWRIQKKNVNLRINDDYDAIFEHAWQSSSFKLVSSPSISSSSSQNKPRLTFQQRLQRIQRKYTLCMFILFCVIGTIVVYFFTYEHEYLLSDNRHYMFYVWKNFYRRIPQFRYMMIPIYFLCAYLLFCVLLNDHPIIWRLVLVLGISGSLIPSRLLEFRYFILPVIFTKLHSVTFYSQRKFSKYDVYCHCLDFIYQLSLNIIVLYVYLFLPFNRGTSRFMW